MMVSEDHMLVLYSFMLQERGTGTRVTIVTAGTQPVHISSRDSGFFCAWLERGKQHKVPSLAV
jgi:hypothetical protein